MWSVKSGVLKSRVWSVGCQVWSVKCGLRGEKCGV